MKLKSVMILSIALGLCGCLMLLAAVFLGGVVQTIVGISGTVLMVAGVIIARLRYRCPGCEKYIPMFVNGYTITHCPFCGTSLDEETFS